MIKKTKTQESKTSDKQTKHEKHVKRTTQQHKIDKKDDIQIKIGHENQIMGEKIVNGGQHVLVPS